MLPSFNTTQGLPEQSLLSQATADFDAQASMRGSNPPVAPNTADHLVLFAQQQISDRLSRCNHCYPPRNNSIASCVLAAAQTESEVESYGKCNISYVVYQQR